MVDVKEIMIKTRTPQPFNGSRTAFNFSLLTSPLRNKINFTMAKLPTNAIFALHEP
jgi:hypothetical protein